MQVLTGELADPREEGRVALGLAILESRVEVDFLGEIGLLDDLRDGDPRRSLWVSC